MARRFLLGGITAALSVGVVVLWQPLAAEWHCHHALQLIHSHQDQKALKELQKALWLHPDSWEPLLSLARVERRLGNLERAQALLRRCEALGGDPERIQRETWLLWAQGGRFAEAEPHLPGLLVDPRDDGPDICQAYMLGYFGEYRVHEATELLEAWTKDHPDDAEAYFMRGYLLSALDDGPKSVDAYRHGLEIAPHRTAMRCRLADMLVGMSEMEEAGSLLRQCAEETPGDPHVLLSWAGWLSAQGDPTAAREALERLLAVAPNRFEALRLFGQIELSQRRFEEALRRLESAARLNPHDPLCRQLLGRTLHSLGRTAEAKPHLDYAAKATPALARTEDQLRMLLNCPDNAELRYEIGSTLLKYGSPEDGVKWLHTVLRLQPDHQSARQALAAYYETCGDRQKAQSLRQGGRAKNGA